MKILLLTRKDISYPHKWWAEVVAYNYAKELVSMWHDVYWVWSWYKWAAKEEIIDWINIIRIFSLKTIYFLARHRYISKWKKYNFDIIIDMAQWIPLLSPFYVKNTPIIFFIHHIWEKERKFEFPFWIWTIFRIMFEMILKLYKNYPTITISQSTKSELAEKYNYNKDNIHVIEDTIDFDPIEDIEFDAKEKQITYVWRISPIKQVEHIIKIFSEFSKNNPEYKLKIIWKAKSLKYEKTLRDLSETLNSSNKIQFLGWVSMEERNETLRKSRFCLFTSMKEWYWLVWIEANALWTPVIWYKVPWLVDSIKHWVNWYLVESWDIDAALAVLEENVDNLIYEKIARSSLKHAHWLPSWWDNARKFTTILSLYTKNKQNENINNINNKK